MAQAVDSSARLIAGLASLRPPVPHDVEQLGIVLVEDAEERALDEAWPAGSRESPRRSAAVLPPRGRWISAAARSPLDRPGFIVAEDADLHPVALDHVAEQPGVEGPPPGLADIRAQGDPELAQPRGRSGRLGNQLADHGRPLDAGPVQVLDDRLLFRQELPVVLRLLQLVVTGGMVREGMITSPPAPAAVRPPPPRYCGYARPGR